MKFYTILFFLLISSFAFAQSEKSHKKEVCKYRKEYKADFLKEERSPFYGKKKELKNLRFYKPDKNYKVACTFERTPNAPHFDMATYSGVTRPYVKYGVITFMLNGKKEELSIYQSITLSKIPKYKNHLFLPFKDTTNDETTYGGGRYIDLESTDIKNGQLTIDFNQAYNPWCAFSDGYSCPIPPNENHLEVAIEAGEQNFAKEH